ncbi:HAD family hydrolase [Streptomyces candidus]|uniref:Tyrosine-protein kinase PtkA n=1 Tax=Streptomyces candidus TaxID=67283 RepID=A0A7X0LTX5_9ACTN|nr:HAD family hydrolase [Streptomyces candidus]MBB6439501.1 phosphoglycolate phosphatase [Streptomyces candidus]
MRHLAVFDLDGTLVDTPRAIVETFSAAFASLGEPVPDSAAIRATIGIPLERAFGSLLGVDPEDPYVRRGIEQYQLHFRELILPRASELLYPGVEPGLRRLHAQGVALAVATNKFHASADALLRAAGLRELFAQVVGADDVSNHKPHPESGLLILRTLDIPADRAVMVGDTTHDLLMANAAGLRSVAVTYGIHSPEELATAAPTWTAHTFDEVVTHLEAVLLPASESLLPPAPEAARPPAPETARPPAPEAALPLAPEGAAT